MSFFEIILITVVAVLILKPTEMVSAMRIIGRFIARMRVLWHSCSNNITKDVDRIIADLDVNGDHDRISGRGRDGCSDEGVDDRNK